MEAHFALLVLGVLLLIGLLTDEIGRRTRLPRVTLLILFGVAAGPSGLDWLPNALHEWYEFLATIALTMVAFLLGSSLSLAKLRRHGKEILVVSLTVVLFTAVLVGAGLIAIGTGLPMALLLAGIATATAPAAIHDVVRQTGAKGPFTETLLGVVAVDDAWGLILFSLLLVGAKAVTGGGISEVLAHGLWELGGALAVGAIVGLPSAYLTGRLRAGQPIQTEALGVVLLCGGLAIWLEVSYLLAGVFAGAIIVNLAKHHDRAFHEIEHIEWPFMILFFVLAGATLHIASVYSVGLIGVTYLTLRAISRIFGGWLGETLADAPVRHRYWFGLALTPQAGVALGMALVSGNHFPELSEALLAITISTTVFFEIVGPILTQLALRKIGEAR